MRCLPPSGMVQQFVNNHHRRNLLEFKAGLYCTAHLSGIVRILLDEKKFFSCFFLKTITIFHAFITSRISSSHNSSLFKDHLPIKVDFNTPMREIGSHTSRMKDITQSVGSGTCRYLSGVVKQAMYVSLVVAK